MTNSFTNQELKWIEANRAYYIEDDPIMSDAEYDYLTLMLQKAEWSFAFKRLINLKTMSHTLCYTE